MKQANIIFKIKKEKKEAEEKGLWPQGTTSKLLFNAYFLFFYSGLNKLEKRFKTFGP